MEKTTKVLIIAVIVLVGIVGVFSGYFISNQPKPISNNSTVYVNQSPTQVSAQPDWHLLTTFKGVNSELDSFNIKGSKCKVVMSAKPVVNYDINILSVDLLKNNGAITTGTISWSATENPAVKEKTLEASGGPGTYQINVYATNLAKWTVTVYDYY